MKIYIQICEWLWPFQFTNVFIMHYAFVQFRIKNTSLRCSGMMLLGMIQWQMAYNKCLHTHILAPAVRVYRCPIVIRGLKNASSSFIRNERR